MVDGKELKEEELDKVTGGTTYVEVNGVKYAVVTSGNNCPIRSEYRKVGIRQASSFLWWIFSSEGQCGCCDHLHITDGGIGYCVIRYFSDGREWVIEGR